MLGCLGQPNLRVRLPPQAALVSNTRRAAAKPRRQRCWRWADSSISLAGVPTAPAKSLKKWSALAMKASAFKLHWQSVALAQRP